MNAPWSPGRSGPSSRDPFAAYVCDEMTAEVLRPVCAELGWPVEKVNKGGLRNAVQSLSVTASPTILFVDLSESGDPLNDINALAEVCEPGTVVIAAGQVNDVRLYRDLLSSGIQDYLLKPFSPDQLRDAIANAQNILNAPKAAEQSTGRAHLVTAVIGVRGGVGASTIATSLGWAFSSAENRSTALLDLDVHFGTAALTLDLEPGRGLTDAIENPGRIDGLFIERALVRANDNLAILSAEAPIHQPLLTDGGAFYQLQEEMRGAFECTVIDLPRNMLVQHQHLINDVNTAVIVAELSLASARDTIRVLSWLKSNAPQTTPLVVLNRVGMHNAPEISKKDFEASIERKVDYCIPTDFKVVTQAAKLGKSVAEAGKGSKLSAVLHEIASDIVAISDGNEVSDKSEKAGGSLLGKFNLSGLMAKMPKPKKAESEKAPAA
jgi:pilus assembly protein CpaE